LDKQFVSSEDRVSSTVQNSIAYLKHLNEVYNTERESKPDEESSGQ
jgi:hypothetical protein